MQSQQPVQAPDRAARWTLVGLLATSLLVADVALAVAAESFPDFPTLILFGVVLGQVAAAAAWLAMGRFFWLARLAAALAVPTALAAPLSQKIHPTMPECLGFLLVHAAAVAALLTVLRLAGMRILVGEATSRPAPSWRYSVGALFAATTAVAIIAAVARAVSFPARDLMIVLVVLAYCGAFAAAALLGLATFLIRRRVWIGWLLALALAPLLGAAVGVLERSSGPLAWITFFTAATACALVWVLQTTGYRAVWIR